LRRLPKFHKKIRTKSRFFKTKGFLAQIVSKRRVVGIDEAHRGSLLGPLVVAGYSGPRIKALKDSKKLTAKQRRELFDLIFPLSDFAVVIIGNRLINSTKLSMDRIERLAALFILALLEGEEIFIDQIGGLRDFLVELKQKGLFSYAPKMEDMEPSVAAASIIAKEIGDEIIKRIAEIAGIDEEDLAKGYWPKDEVKKKLSMLQRNRWSNKI